MSKLVEWLTQSSQKRVSQNTYNWEEGTLRSSICIFNKISPALKNRFNLVGETNKETHAYNLETKRLAPGDILQTMVLPCCIVYKLFATEAQISKTSFELDI